MFFARWRQQRANRSVIDQIHGEIVAASREPALFGEFGVPDDLDGRFEMMALHAGLALRALAKFGERSRDLAQALIDRLFEGFEDALREMAIGDAGVAKRLKSMASAFHGRGKIYSEALASGDSAALASALARNAYRGAAVAPGVDALAERVMAAARLLELAPYESFAEGRFQFPRPERRAS